MSNVLITPKKLYGTIPIQASKSVLHRAIICAALSGGESKIKNINCCEDVLATIDCIEGLGLAKCRIVHNELIISGGEFLQKDVLDCKESGSTMRFIIPVCLLKNKNITLTGKGRLMSRPMKIYKDICVQHGFFWEQDEDQIKLKGKLQAGTYKVAGDVSSQFITGLMLALPLLLEDSKIIIEGKLESRPYVDITSQVQQEFGVKTYFLDDNTIVIPGNQKYQATDYFASGDFSHAAFFATCGVAFSDITLTGLDFSSKQGDKQIFDVLKAMGGDIEILENKINCKKSNLKGIRIDASQIPDLVPILAVAGCFASGETVIYNAQRLRIKECDRLMAITKELKELGAYIIEKEDGLVITGVGKLVGGKTNSHNDHRIAMALSIASCGCTNSVIIEDSDCVKKSAPEFFNEFKNLKGDFKYV